MAGSAHSHAAPRRRPDLYAGARRKVGSLGPIIAGFVALVLVLGAMLTSELGNYGSQDDNNDTTANEPTGAPPAAAKPVVPQASPDPSASATSGGSVSDQAAAALNQELDTLGCAPVTVDSRLVANAQSHTVLMLRTGYYDDISPGGTGPQDRARAAGYDAKVTESIVLGADNVSDATKFGFPTPVASGDALPATVEVVARNTLTCGWAHIGAQSAKDSRGVQVWSIVLGR